MIRIRVQLPLDGFELDVWLDLARPVTALFGPSGVGKTSLLETVAGLRSPTAGEIRLDDELLYSSRDGVYLPPEKRRIGYVPQDALLFPHLNVMGNLRFGARGTGDSIPFDSVVEALEVSHLLERDPASLSGGERQRVALGRALLSGPRLLLMDEPLAALDAELKGRILPYLNRLRESYHISAIVVSHDVSEVFTLSDEVVVLDRGAVVDQGEPRDVLTRPGSDRSLFQDRFENILDVTVTGQEPDEGMTRVRTPDGLTLAIPHQASEAGSAALVGILAEDVLLARSRPVGLSARNIIPGRVDAIDERDGVAMIRVSTPDPIYVRLTHRAVAQLELGHGTPVHLIIKTHSIHRLGARR